MEQQVEVARTPRVSVWSRRRSTLAGHWATFRSSGRGMTGLAILTFFAALAIASPLLVSPEDLDPALASLPPHAAPSAQAWLGTDNFGRSVVDLLIAGARVSLLVGIVAALGTMLIGAVVGISAGYFAG
ncbi:MAG: ABC transporter permease, partial [Actinomycetota bacterium]